METTGGSRLGASVAGAAAALDGALPAKTANGGRWTTLPRSLIRWSAWALLGLTLLPMPARGTSEDQRRGRLGIKLLRQMLNADVDLESKTLDDGSLLVLVAFERDRRWAEELVRAFGAGESAPLVKGLPVKVEVVSTVALRASLVRPPVAIFIAEDFGNERLDELIDLGIEHHILIYSPFEGHVERGAAAGLVIEAHVRPYVNLATLQASKIQLKALFMRVTKVYGDE